MMVATNMTSRGNLDMFLLHFDHNDASSYASGFPNLGFSYGVFGEVSSETGLFVTWEEQKNNINSCYRDGQKSYVNGNSGVPGVNGIISGYTGTDILLSKVH